MGEPAIPEDAAGGNPVGHGTTEITGAPATGRRYRIQERPFYGSCLLGEIPAKRLARRSEPRVPVSLATFILLTGLAAAYCSPQSTPPSSDDAGEQEKKWNFHVQATAIPQGHGGIRSPYASALSLSPNGEVRTSVTNTYFVGLKPWRGAEVYINAEILAGNGLSGTHGVAGFSNGEIYRVDKPSPKLNLSRYFIRQTWGLGGDPERLGDDQNQLPMKVDASRFTVAAGKFSLADFFDGNTYSHDARTQFMNWALMDNGAWDFAADTRGYTYGLVLEFSRRQWAARFGSVAVPKVANGMALDWRLGRARADNLEIEHRHTFAGHPGAFRAMGFINHADMGNYRTTIDTPAFQMDVTRSRTDTRKYGFGFNGEQEIAKGVGVFFRYGWNDGHTETWAFTEIDRTGSGGLSVKGDRWKRSADYFGLAAVVNGLSKDHADYLRAGGKGFIIGDGALNYGREKIIETYYSFGLGKGFSISPDFQYVSNPAYNRDRGPAQIWALRFHWEI
jgi:high affinity Mn2+ porin